MIPGQQYQSGHRKLVYAHIAYSLSSVQMTEVLSRPCPTPGLIQSLQSHCSSTAQLWLLSTYSGRARADNLPLSMTLGLCSIHLLPHLAV